MISAKQAPGQTGSQEDYEFIYCRDRIYIAGKDCDE